jgi:hypothetical protein
MNRDQARQLIRDTFEKPYDKGRFYNFTRNLLKSFTDAPFLIAGNRVQGAFSSYIKSYERIGIYKTPDERIDILAVYLKKEESLDRARTMQRNFIAGYLSGKWGTDSDKNAALVAFVSPDATDWRFSLVKLEYSIKDARPREEFTPARRYSFLVGEHESSHTAQSRLIPLLENDDDNPTLSQLEEKFNVEVVTNEFFVKYRDLFIRVKEALDSIVQKNAEVKADFNQKGVSTVDFAKKLLGQIVFLYFLQKKGWFGVARDSAYGTGSKHFLRELFRGKHGSYQNFFNDILESLFYDALRVDRRYNDDFYDTFKCKIPFLNGGLFDPIKEYDWIHTDILLPNELFSNRKSESDEGSGILDIFDLYNFTVKEDEPLEQEVAIDPEMLGKTFEKLGAISPDKFDDWAEAVRSGNKRLEHEANKKLGVYYTPREIVHYMCQESLINYLFTACNPPAEGSGKSYQKLGNGQIKAFGNETLKPGITQDLYIEEPNSPPLPREALETFIKQGEDLHENEVIAMQREQRIADGLQKSTDLKSKMPECIRHHARLIDEKLAAILVCDPAVGSGAFPVGMMKEIIQARKVLSTYLPTDPRRNPYDFKRHAIQSCLYGVDIDTGAVEIAKLRLWLSLIVDEEDIKRIKPLPNLDFKIVCGNSLMGFPEKVIQNLDIQKIIENLKAQHYEETNATEKKALKDQIEANFRELVKEAKHYSANVGDVSFDFKMYFSEIFHANEGFDIVIANPPYIRQEQIKESKPALKERFDCFEGTADIFVYFYERGLQILRDKGILTYITSNKYFRAGYGQKLRLYLGGRCTIHQIIDFGDAPVFEAIAYPSIIVLRKQPANGNSIKVLTWNPDDRLDDFPRIVSSARTFMLQKELTGNGWQLESPSVLRLLEKLRNTGKPLGDYVDGRIYYGIKTALNEAFVVDRTTRDRLIAECSSSADLLKPYFRGKDIKRWTTDFAELYLIKIESSENVHHPWSGKPEAEAENIFARTYPAIYNWFKTFHQQLKNRDDQGKYFWELRTCKYWNEFEVPKIIVPALMVNPNYTFDDNNACVNAPAGIICTDEKHLLGILNSSTLWFYFQNITIKVQQGYLRIYLRELATLPIPNATTAQKKEIATLVQKCLDGKGVNCKDRERQIDHLVYQLYGLTAEEIAVVEGATGGK